METSPLLNVPFEIRMMIYDYLFYDAGCKRLIVRNAIQNQATQTHHQSRVRTKYWVMERTLHRRYYETTYFLAMEAASFCAPLMRTNRQIYHETSHLVYGRHHFDFGRDIEAVEPFLSDLTPANRSLIREISIYKRGPFPLYENDRSEWRRVCKYLCESGAIRRLRLVVEGGRPSVPWDGPKEFSAADLQLLSAIKHESLDWVSDLAMVKCIEEIEVVPDVHYCPPPCSTSMIIFAAFSASIEKGLTEFLRSQMRLSG